MSIKKVVLIGAGGNLGPSLLEALTANFEVTVLSRQSSTSKFPSNVKVATIADDFPHSELVAAFKGQDAVVSAVAGAAIDKQTLFIDAAIEAGVQRFVPGDFGSDTQDPTVLANVPFLNGKHAVNEYLAAKAATTSLTWTAIANGAFIDWALRFNFLRIDPAQRSATVFDTGNERFHVSTLRQVGRAVAAALLRPEQTKNRFLYIQSFATSQNEIVAEFEKATGAKFDVKHEKSADLVAEGRAKLAQGDFFANFLVLLAEVLKTSGWEKKEGYANDLLELPKESIADVVKEVVAST